MHSHVPTAPRRAARPRAFEHTVAASGSLVSPPLAMSAAAEPVTPPPAAKPRGELSMLSPFSPRGNASRVAHAPAAEGEMLEALTARLKQAAETLKSPEGKKPAARQALAAEFSELCDDIVQSLDEGALSPAKAAPDKAKNEFVNAFTNLFGALGKTVQNGGAALDALKNWAGGVVGTVVPKQAGSPSSSPPSSSRGPLSSTTMRLETPPPAKAEPASFAALSDSPMAELSSPSKRIVVPVPAGDAEKPATPLSELTGSPGQHSWATGLDQAGAPVISAPASGAVKASAAKKEPPGGCACSVQ